ncbi:MAG: hypothetical protein J0H01_25095 [Rhizobiales bacterium]|nr:hypothetical protein [Hyphomicrobiales bacterium]
MDEAHQVRSFSVADRAAMRTIYRRCCVELGVGGGSTRQHQVIARTILERYAAGATDPERLAVLALAGARKAARRRSLWASLTALLARHQAGVSRA